MTEKQNTSNSAATGVRKKKKEKSAYIFPVGITFLAAICLPYYYYAININAYGIANKPEGYVMPEYKDLWKTVVGGIVC